MWHLNNKLMAKFEIYQDSKEEFRFRLKASNGQIVLASEGYKTKVACENGIVSVRVNSQNPDNFESFESKQLNFYFNLKASNGKIIGTSETYSRFGGMEYGIAVIVKIAPKATIVDLILNH